MKDQKWVPVLRAGLAQKNAINQAVYRHDAKRKRAQPTPRGRTQRDLAGFIHRQMIDMSVTWINPSMGTTLRESPLFRFIKNYVVSAPWW
jgi:hypothetical protein